MFPSSMGFCSQVSALWGKHGSIGLKLRPTVTPEEKIERGHEEEREGSPIPIFPPLRFGIVRLLTG